MLAAFFVERLSDRRSIFDPDSYHEMALFRDWLRAGVFPLGDVFAFTPTVFPAVHHEWGSGALMYFYAMVLGAAGVMAVRWILSAAIFARRREARAPPGLAGRGGVLAPRWPSRSATSDSPRFARASTRCSCWRSS